MISEEQVKLLCGWCGHKGIYTKRSSGEKGRVSNSISCEKCGHQLNHKVKWE